MIEYFVLLSTVTFTLQQALAPYVNITSTIMLSQEANAVVIADGQLNHIYDDSVYNNVLNCKNGELTIINNTFGNKINFTYSGLNLLNDSNTHVYVEPNHDPRPFLHFFTPNAFTLEFNCSGQIDNDNYFNKLDIELQGRYNISFLLDCDPGTRHKTFQYGYLIITAINALILVGVAMNSYIWSLKYNRKMIRIELEWKYILAMCVIGVVLASALYFFASNSFIAAFVTLRYVGIAFSTFFIFICFNQVLFLIKALRSKIKYFIRGCDLLSLVATLCITTLALLIENWILYDAIACCICVASIKLFYFSSLKQAFISKGIVVITVTIVAVVLHYVLPDRSYNDYATELSSPLFLMVPDLDQGLYKKCSWLLVADVIVPGVMLAYLRLYDENKGSKWGGVYTVWGNVTVILATILWVGLQAVYPFSVPFSLVVYLLLMLVVFLLSWERNEWGDLYRGNFQKDRSVIDESKLYERNNSFSALIGEDVIVGLRTKEGSSEYSGSGRNSSIYHN